VRLKLVLLKEFSPVFNAVSIALSDLLNSLIDTHIFRFEKESIRCLS